MAVELWRRADCRSSEKRKNIRSLDHLEFPENSYFLNVKNMKKARCTTWIGWDYTNNLGTDVGTQKASFQIYAAKEDKRSDYSAHSFPFSGDLGDVS